MNWTFSQGVLDLTLWGLFWWTIVVTQITIATVTIYLHRYAAHRSLELHPALVHFFRFWAWLTTGMRTWQWVGVHRVHHAKCESKDDPHSPVQKGLWHIVFFGVKDYTEAAALPSIRKAAPDAPKDAIERNLYSKHPWLGIVLLLVLNVFLHGLNGILIFLIQAWWIPFWAAGIINGVGHWTMPMLSKFRLLYQNYKDGELVPEKFSRFPGEVFTNVRRSANILPFGLWIGGEELHGNHHAFPTSPKFSRKWYEFDIGWILICVLRVFGLAKLKSNYR